MRILSEDSKEYKNLMKATSIMNKTAEEMGFKGNYYVGETYLDFGQDWKWTTILYSKGRNGFQALYPGEWELICNKDQFSQVEQIVKEQVRILEIQ